ncbi:UNVERIFIED_CONTAM: hypothetical protein OHV15_05980 [Microbacterium sp. SLM126]
MDNGSLLFGWLGLPIVIGLIVGGFFAFLIALIAASLGFTRLVAFTIDSLRARLREGVRGKQAVTQTAPSSKSDIAASPD